MAENSLNKTTELQQVLGQIEANLSLAEYQKINDSKNEAKNNNLLQLTLYFKQYSLNIF